MRPGWLAVRRSRQRAQRRLVQRFWDGFTPRQLAPLLAAAFLSFAPLGFLTDVMRLGGASLQVLALLVALSGGVAVAYLYLGVRRRWWGFVPVVAVQTAVAAWVSRSYASALQPAGDELRRRLTIDAAGAIVCLAAGYALFMTFINSEGVRRVRAQTEMALARDIHQALVPAVSLASRWCEIHGRSLPATEVGGDLVDAFEARGRTLALVADVSGHGVPAGMLTGLLKAGLRTRLRTPGDVAAVLSDLNDLLAELTQPNTFATAALVSCDTPGRLSYALAGHPPLLHWRSALRSVARLEERGIALGIRPGERYPLATVDVSSGDVLVALTDGVTETADALDRELGLEPVERALAAHATEPLPELLERLLEVARSHGAQQDDRTLLVARVLAG